MPRTELVRITTTDRLPLIQRWAHALRSYWLGPFTPSNWPGPEAAVWGQNKVSSGVYVSEETALNYSAVFSAVSIISADISSLPLMLFKRLANGGKDRYEDHRLYPLLHDMPNPEMTSMVFRETLQAHALLWGNAYAEIERDKTNRPIALWPLTPDRVTPVRDGRNGPLRYRVVNGSDMVYLEPERILHVPGLGFDGICGYSVVAKARESMGLGLAAERFGGAFFGNGASMGGVITYPGDPPIQVKKENRETLAKRHEGVDNAHRMLALYGGAKYERIGIPPDDAQFLETRVFQVRDVARWFKLPPHKLADLADATFSNVEQQNTDYYISCLRPWLEKWEQELERKLIAPLERRQQFVEHVVEGFLRADATGRAALEKAHFEIGATTPNEIRNSENRDPIAGGDRSFVPLNMVPLDRVDELIDAQIAEKKQPKTTPAPPTEDQVNSFIAVLERQIVARDTDIEKHRALAQAAETARDDALGQVDALQRERDEAQARIESVSATLADVQLERLAVEGRSALERDRLQAEIDRLTEQVRAEQGAKNDVDVMLGVAEKQRTETEAALAEALKKEATAAEQARALAAERDRLAQQATETKVVRMKLIEAQRGLFSDALGRMIRREVANARRYQATPQKLRSWISGYYDESERMLFIEALLPSIRVLCAWSGAVRVPTEIAQAFVDVHFRESQRQLTELIEAGPDGFGETLQRVLYRWESSRADQSADCLMSEGWTHGS